MSWRDDVDPSDTFDVELHDHGIPVIPFSNRCAIEMFRALVAYVAEFGHNDLSDCDYFRSNGNGGATCSHDCANRPNPEPECMTMRPGTGWPMEDVHVGLRERIERAAGLYD